MDKWFIILTLFLGTNEKEIENKRYVELCPGQRKSSPCNPKNIDKFVDYHINKGDNITDILSKTYIHGTCFYNSKKYCPIKLEKCQSEQNHGHRWTLKGKCEDKSQVCPPLRVLETCFNISCPPDEYFCNPKGCVKNITPCHGHCQPFNLVPCGGHCIDKKEAREKFSCGENCIPRTEMCTLKGASNCSQHYSKCGSVCVEKFSQEMWKGLTGRDLYHACDSQCLNYSQPCKGKCMPGYWLCHTSTECILSSTMQRGTNMSSLCDGKLDCSDQSDEAWLVCLQVYSSDVTSVAVLFIFLLVAIFLFIYVIKQQILVIKFYGKSKLLEMHMNSVHHIEMK